MIFITGGAYQGKYEYAQNEFKSIDKKPYIIINSYHLRVREQLEKGLSVVLELEKLLDKYRDDLDRLVIISDEVGCGVVPLDKKDRDFREANGRVSCLLSKKAKKVVRVVCSIPVVLKDE